MLRKNLSAAHWARVGVFGLLTITAAAICTTDSAEARRSRHHHHRARHHVQHRESGSYSPAFSSIIVDGNSGAILQSNNPDASRHPASLTKIMTLYLLFERLEAGKMKLDTEMAVSEHASEQAPTKLGLRPGQTIRVEDAIKGLVTRSANDAAVVIGEAIGGDEEDFAKMMTRKARALGMTKTVYRNASGLPDDDQVTTARDQATLGRAIQERFPRYYRYFSTTSFTFRGRSIANHNHLLGSMEGIDGIKTGYTRASGFNLVSSIRRGNRHLIGVVLGGRSAGSRDATMRSLLAENLEKARTVRTAAAITERGSSGADVDLADATETRSRSLAPSVVSRAFAAIAAANAPAQPKVEQKVEPPAPLTNGVIQSQPLSVIPGTSEPMKPVRVKTVLVKAGPLKVASATTPSQPAPVTSAIPAARTEAAAETSGTVIAKAETTKTELSRPEDARAELPRQPPGFGTGHGILGVLPASSVPAASGSQAVATIEPTRSQPQQNVQQDNPAKPAVTHTGWMIQVGALDSAGEAQQRIEAARNSARGLLNKADPFTEEATSKDNRKIFRARFAGLERDQAEAACRALKRATISCMTIRN